MLMIHIYKTNAVNANIYVLVEFALYCWQFRCWNSLSTKSWHFLTVISFMSSIWVYENILTGEITSFNSLFRICASFCIIFLSIDQVNRLIAMARGNLFRNSLFLICMGLIIFFSYKSVIEVFYLLRLPLSDVFYDNIFFLLTLINIFVNLIFAIAVLWIPTKQKFILPY